ncbi:hypothetical protein ACJ41O_001911 [Fusarium nematophilum]
MSLSSSPSRDVTNLFRRRNVTNIPADQRELLEKPDSWAVDARNRPHGLANIPGHVLKTAKEAYTIRKAASGNPQPLSRKRSGSPAASASSKRLRSSVTATPRQDPSNRPPSTSPERQISWSPSPNAPSPSPSSIHVAFNSTVQSSIVRETPKTAPVAARPQRNPLPSLPSSDGPEPDLETELPQALPRPDVSINRTANRLNPTAPSPISSTNRVMATPPCAQPVHPTQPVIPSTVAADKQIGQGQATPGKRRSRKFKVIEFDDTEKKVHHPPNRLPTTKTFATVESSIPTSSDSIIPNTYKAPPTQDSVIQSIEENEPVHNNGETARSDADRSSVARSSRRTKETILQSIEESDADKDIQTPKKQNGEKTAAAKRPNNSKEVENQRKSLRPRQTPTTEPDPRPPPLLIGPSETLEPFAVFLRHYPEYTAEHYGTKGTFVNACVYLNYLRRRNMLRDVLYDDFIRAFTDDYSAYLDTVKPGQKPMVAIEWFNKQPEPVLYDKVVVDRSNLSYILKYYFEEVARANKAMMQDDDISIYTSDSEAYYDHNRLSGGDAVSDRASHEQGHGGTGVEATQEAPLSLDGGMEIDSPKTPTVPHPEPRKEPPSSSKVAEKSRPAPTPPSSSRPRKAPTQAPPPFSSRPRDILTQAPPPPSPQIPTTSMAPPSTIATPVAKRAPRSSQYLDRLASSRLSATPGGRTAAERAKLREHFLKRKSLGGNKPRSVRHSSSRVE